VSYNLEVQQLTQTLAHGVEVVDSPWGVVQNGGATSYSASGQSGGGYTYRIQACNTVGCGAWTSADNEQEVIVGIPNTPTNPQIIVATNGGTTTYTAQWDAMGGATSYQLTSPGLIQPSDSGPADKRVAEYEYLAAEHLGGRVQQRRLFGTGGNPFSAAECADAKCSEYQQHGQLCGELEHANGCLDL
jgi:hypothetical protein